MNLLERIKAPLPKRWKKWQRIALTIGGIGAALAAAPITLPTSIATLSGYMITIGGIGAAVAQLGVDEHKKD